MENTDAKIKRLRTARKAAGLSQNVLAKLAGMAEGTITFYETGRRNIPDDVLEKLVKLCKASLKKRMAFLKSL